MNTINIFKHIVKNDGYKGLFRGNFVNVLKVAPEKSLKFLSYEKTKEFIKHHKKSDELNANEIFIAAAFSSIFAHLLLQP
jgi:solute carrier family 25 phosphate transporter 23/24/25/41